MHQQLTLKFRPCQRCKPSGFYCFETLIHCNNIPSLRPGESKTSLSSNLELKSFQMEISDFSLRKILKVMRRANCEHIESTKLGADSIMKFHRLTVSYRYKTVQLIIANIAQLLSDLLHPLYFTAHILKTLKWKF